MTARLEMWVVSDGPRDFPHHVVARRWLIGDAGGIATGDLILGGSLEDVEGRLPAGLTYLPPDPGDDPIIVGVYV